MSISQPNQNGQNPNPAKKHIRFKNGKFQYWDKAEEKNIEVSLPFEFIVLDELSAITGWSDKHQSGIHSNEIVFTPSDELVVKAFKGGELVRGLYRDIKDKVKAEGGRYEKSVYALMDGELVRFGFVGAALSSWIGTEVGFTQPKFMVSKTEDAKKGATAYKVPIFAVVEATKEEFDEAKKMDVEILRPYMKKYLKTDPIKLDTEDMKKAGTPEAKREAKKEVEDIEIDDLPF